MSISFDQPLYLLFWILIPLYWIRLRRKGLSAEKPVYRRPFILFKSLILLLLGITLAQPVALLPTNRVNLLYCLDQSSSIAEQSAQGALDFIKRSSDKAKQEDATGLILFAEQASFEQDLQSEFRIGRFRSYLDSSETSIYNALQMAIGRFPADGSNRVVLLSDGNENRGNALDMAYLASSMGIRVDTIALEVSGSAGDIVLEKLESPTRVQLDQPFTIRMIVSVGQAGEARLKLFRGDEQVVDRMLKLNQGTSAHEFVTRLVNPGLHTFRAEIASPADNEIRNNRGVAFVQGTVKPQILFVKEEGRREVPMAKALENQGFDLKMSSGRTIPSSLSALINYSAIVLDNTSADSLTIETLANLELFVRDTGGGLVMLGGYHSYGNGGYAGTPVEKAMPLFMEPRTTMEFPGLCLILLLDKSSSMGERIDRVSKLEAAKTAAYSAVELLNPVDRVGVLGFDSSFRWVVPLTRASMKKDIADRLTALKEGGGTNLIPVLKEAIKSLKEIKAVKKHIIILTDGITENDGLIRLISTLKDEPITISTVAVGKNSNFDLLKAIADSGGGRSYYTEKATRIPRIFMNETKVVSKSSILEAPSQPQQVARHELLDYGELAAFPLVNGYNLTYPKPGADVILTVGDDPLLSGWQYGLGRAVAFTSDLSTRWNTKWLDWNDYGIFVSRLIKWVQRSQNPEEFHFTLTRKKSKVELTLDAIDRNNQFINHLNLGLNLLSPRDSSHLYSLEQTLPGRYNLHFSLDDVGDYYLNVFNENDTRQFGAESLGVALPYSQELAVRTVNRDLLRRISEITGGQVLSLSDREINLYRSDGSGAGTKKPLWPLFIVFTIILFVADIALNKLRFLRTASVEQG